MEFAIVLLAFTAGLLLHPVAASLTRKVVLATQLRRQVAAIRLLEANGYTVGFANSDDTIAMAKPVNDDGWFDAGKGTQ